MKLKLPLIAVFVAVLGLTACGGGGSDSAPSVTVNNPTSLTKTDTVTGTGADAVLGKQITVNYTGWLYDSAKADFKGARFDGGSGINFLLGGRLIDGWNQGIPGMKVGGKRTLLVPSNLGYGANGSPPIPPNAGLVFEVELVAVN